VPPEERVPMKAVQLVDVEPGLAEIAMPDGDPPTGAGRAPPAPGTGNPRRWEPAASHNWPMRPPIRARPPVRACRASC
jgi:hypothetical protein